MRFHKFDGQHARSVQGRATNTNLVNWPLVEQLLIECEKGRFTRRTSVRELAARLHTDRTTLHRQMAIAERLLGVKIRIAPGEERIRVADWGAVRPEWIRERMPPAFHGEQGDEWIEDQAELTTS